MTNSADSSFVDAVLDEAKRKAAADPNVRGANFRYAVVTAVNSNGTVSIGDIRARRHQSYHSPSVGDQVVIMQAGNRNWIALGLLAGTTDSGGWTNLTLASGFSQPGHGYPPSWLREGKRIWLRGRIQHSSGSISSGATIATLPTALRPAGNQDYGWAGARNQISTASLTRVEITPAGVLRIFEGGSAPTWIGLDGASYLTD